MATITTKESNYITIKVTKEIRRELKRRSANKDISMIKVLEEWLFPKYD